MEGVRLLMRLAAITLRKVPYVLMNITNHKTVYACVAFYTF